MNSRTAEQIWEAALGQLQLQVSRANYETWLKDTVGLANQSDQFIIGAPSTFVIEWLEKRLRPLIKKTLISIIGHSIDAHFEVYNPQPGKGKIEHNPSGQSVPNSTSGIYSNARTDVRASLVKLNPKYIFSTFIEGNCNSMARAGAWRVAQRPGRDYNPLFIYGGVGLGKTHLLHAIGHEVLKTSSHILCVTSEQFTNEFISAIKEGKTEEFRNRYRSLVVLLIDDIHFIANKEQTQEAFFHTFNELHNTGRQIVITSDRSPKSMPLLEERLRSRFEGGLKVEVEPPDLETRLAILRAKAEQQRVTVPPEVLDFIARKVQKNIRELEGSLNRVITLARLIKADLTPELAAQALIDLTTVGQRGRPITPELIINVVANYFGIDATALRGSRRHKQIALVRQVTMYLIREETQRPLAAIGRELGGRSHTTILRGYEKIANEIDSDPELRRDILHIRDILYASKD